VLARIAAATQVDPSYSPADASVDSRLAYVSLRPPKSASIQRFRELSAACRSTQQTDSAIVNREFTQRIVAEPPVRRVP